jgi:phage terminase Nu1 subunit (DNA packaging protein)
MQLNRSELARAFNVSLNTIGNWVIRDCPWISAGGPGVPSVFEFRAVAAWIAMYKNGPDHSDPNVWIRTAFQRARALVAARNKMRTPHG